MAIRGKEFVLSVAVNGSLEPICFATDCIINQDLEAKETTGPQGKNRSYIGGNLGYSISCPGLIVYTAIANYLQLEDIYKSRQPVAWEARDNEDGGVVHSGFMLMTNLELTSANRDVMRFSMEALGTDEKGTNLLPFHTTAYLANQLGAHLTGCPDPYPVSVYWYDMTFIGLAFNSDDVVTVFNEYPGNLYYTLAPGPDGCNFNLTSEWNAPFIPKFVIAEGSPDMVLSPDQFNNMALSPDQTADEAQSPAYT